MNWNYNKFRAYLFLVMAHGDMNFSGDEKEYILSKIDREHYDVAKEEFEKDSDYESIQKLMEAAKTHCADDESRQKLIDELKGLISADGNVSIEEKNLLLYLKRLLG